ncbi:cation:proton antiporter [Pseudalkalibacillus caeni]|uniref:Sodium:proton antiporter n=1 Tax=Exobacillus caeni TaxID=2574798 RepID=A0A5R9EWI3_9BACL|nr:sodium:proton antiporter [Pseudalkalibacillus caeni]TLS35009.1 sodium:proton antiporter [Pseudalkalibacillus caeni]
MTSAKLFILLLIGFIVNTVNKKQKSLPVPIVLLFIGIGLSFIPFFDTVELTRELIFDWFLPALLFVASYRFPFKNFRQKLGLITVLGTIGIILMVLLLAWAMYLIGSQFVSLPFLGFLLISAILTPTDPVSVGSILKKVSDSPKVAEVVEGESLLNDGTSIVVFSVAVSMFIDREPFHWTEFLFHFFYHSIGAVFLGFLFSYLFSKAIHWIDEQEYEIMLSIVLAYMSFYLAETLGTSGVLATVAAGLTLSWELERTDKEPHLRQYLDGFWNVMEPAILFIIFLLVGIESANYLATNLWPLIFLTFVLSVVIRFVVLAVLIKPIPKWRREFSWKDITVMSWSGIKGTMSLALLLGFAAINKGNEIILSLTFGTILLSFVIESLTIYPLSKKLMK